MKNMLVVVLIFVFVWCGTSLESRDVIQGPDILGHKISFSNSVMLAGLKDGSTRQINLDRRGMWEIGNIIETDNSEQIIDFKNGKYVLLDTEIGKTSVYTMGDQRSTFAGEISIPGSRVVAASQPIFGFDIFVLSERLSSKRLTLSVYEITDTIVLKTSSDLGIPEVQTEEFLLCAPPAGKYIHLAFGGKYYLFKYEDGQIRKTSELSRPGLLSISCSDNSYTILDGTGNVVVGEVLNNNLIGNTFFESSNTKTKASIFNTLLFIGNPNDGIVKVYKKTILNDINVKWEFLTQFESTPNFKSMVVDVDYESVILGHDDYVVVHSGFSTRDLLSCPAKTDISKDVLKNMFTGISSSIFGTSFIILAINRFVGNGNYNKLKTNTLMF